MAANLYTKESSTHIVCKDLLEHLFNLWKLFFLKISIKTGNVGF